MEQDEVGPLLLVGAVYSMEVPANTRHEDGNRSRERKEEERRKTVLVKIVSGHVLSLTLEHYSAKISA